MNINSKYPKGAGIYKLVCIDSGKVYIGKAININRRINNHKNCYRNSGVKHLKNAILKYGWDSFEVEILEIVENFDKIRDNAALLKREAYYIEMFDSTNTDRGYNLCKYSIDRTGILHSEESKEKMRKGNLGKKHSDETKEKIRQGNLGKVCKPHSPETKERISQSKVGKPGTPHSEETKNKLKQINTGRVLSEETKNKMRDSALNRWNKQNSKL